MPRFTKTPFYSKYKKLLSRGLPTHNSNELLRSVKKINWKDPASFNSKILGRFVAAFAEYAMYFFYTSISLNQK